MHIVVYIHILKQIGQDKGLAYIHLSTLPKNNKPGGFQIAVAAPDFLVLGKA